MFPFARTVKIEELVEILRSGVVPFAVVEAMVSEVNEVEVSPMVTAFQLLPS